MMGESIYLEIRVTSGSLCLLYVQSTYDGNYVKCIMSGCGELSQTYYRIAGS